MAGVIREGAVRENSGLIHIHPHTAHADIGHLPLQQPRPPVARIRRGEIREGAQAGPHIALQQGTVMPAAEHIALKPAAPHKIIRVNLDARVSNRHHLETVIPQALHHAGGVGEMLPAPGERLVILHVVDIQVNRIAGNLVLAHLAGQAHHIGFRVVAPFALVVAQRPERGQGRQPGEPRVTRHRVQRIGTGNEVVIHVSAISAEQQAVLALAPEIEVRAHGVIKENAVLGALVQAQEEGDALVERVALRGELVVICPPHLQTAAAQIQRAGLIPQPEEMRLGRHMLQHPHQVISRVLGAAVPHALRIRAEQAPRRALIELQPAIQPADAYLQPSRAHGHITRRLFFLQLRRLRGILRCHAITGHILKNRLGHIATPHQPLLQKTKPEPGIRQLNLERVRIHPLETAHIGIEARRHAGAAISD